MHFYMFLYVRAKVLRYHQPKVGAKKLEWFLSGLILEMPQPSPCRHANQKPKAVYSQIPAVGQKTYNASCGEQQRWW